MLGGAVRPRIAAEGAVSGGAVGAKPRASYHHGELRRSLIAATRRLIGERGEDRFSLADACRAAGVTTAAPYRHFADKDELLQAVVAEGFLDLTQRTRDAAARQPGGSEARVLEIGRTYLAFGLGEPALFRMMFAQTPGRAVSALVNEHGRACFEAVLDEVAAYGHAHRIVGDARIVALQLWSFVHGVTGLVSGRGYAEVAPDLDVDHLLATAAERLLFSLPSRAPESLGTGPRGP
jgi:AcrR family transcriptional regulator